jgi:hypothetical protein
MSQEVSGSHSVSMDAHSLTFVDRRTTGTERKSSGFERRQFSNSHEELSAEARELAEAVDSYKLEHRRRFINFDELLSVIKGLGYSKQA